MKQVAGFIMKGMPADLQSEMAAAAQNAVAHARKHWATDLDYSPTSIEDLELILARMYDSIPRNFMRKLFKRKPSEEQMAQICIAYGAYLGEVFRREFGGDWQKCSSNGSESIALCFPEGSALFPMAKVWKRLHDGPAESIDNFYQVFSTAIRNSREGKEPFPWQESDRGISG